MIPSVGRIVHYTLNEADVVSINRRRADARAANPAAGQMGVMVHVGNDVHEGDVYPLLITRVWSEEDGGLVNGQVHLDGNDLYWATSRREGTGPGYWFAPPRV